MEMASLMFPETASSLVWVGRLLWNMRMKPVILFSVSVFLLVALCLLYNLSSTLYNSSETRFFLPQNAQMYTNLCYKPEGSGSIESLYSVVQSWRLSSKPVCRDAYDLLSRIFTVSQETGEINIPSQFEAKLHNEYHFSDSLLMEMKQQTITKVFNKVTHDSNMFNPFREKRPIASTRKEDKEYVKRMTEETAKNCDFCNYRQYTATDIFGHIESKYSVTAANAFKYERWHTMVLFREHHPLNWNLDSFLDVFHTASTWYQSVYNQDPLYAYPTIAWDLLPHASASQIHPHIHLSLSRDYYFGSLEHWRLSALDYSKIYPSSNYFTDLIAVHDLLGLVTYHGQAAAIATLTPKRDNEFVVISAQPDDDFYTLLYYVTKTYLDKMEKFCFSMVINLPPMGTSQSNGDHPLPTFARVVTRGPVSQVRSDVSSLELFAGSNVNVDPYKATASLREYMEKF